MTDARERLLENVVRTRQRIAQAAHRSGRAEADVLLLAVTKYVDTQVTRWLVEAGCLALAESRPQALCAKASAIADPTVCWHLIGHLQRNKIRRTLPWLQWIHSVDSLRLLDALQQEAGQQERSLHVLLEVNISGDAQKTGLAIDEALQIAPQLGRWPHLSVEGLMGMSALEGDTDMARADYRRLRTLRDTLQQRCPAGITLQHLSMGMSRDFEVAIEEGATIVRVGSLLFEGVVE
ncbi:MAG: YggS family pyridoxal phosphate-dependent enzyme [Pirellulaceae bacterium]